ncbi:potassium channel family protein [Cytobacillus sp. NCCP-133]|uniref:potassium channel family protein n=1 Tax=Cytobacillus sp. NCCP-133 TaxID=766848 RepID=UPI002230179C|nr:TrkA family potassium uptake protein [Cytobacillus sp. NCCP-133]GLB62102.1 ktr system potassium uptake protein C [Cytobacillus sp. NCCP-133]
MKNQYAVFGLGRFGGSLVKEFHELGAEVLAIDIDQEIVNQFSHYATYAVQINAIDEDALKQVGIRNIDHAFVSFGENIESSILTSLLLKEFGIPKVWAKAHNEYHAKVLEKIGVDRVIHPERDMAKRIAHHIVSEKIIDFIELSEDHSIVEIIASKKVHNKSLSALDVRAKFGCNIVGIQRGNEIIVSPSAEELIFDLDVLIVMGHNDDINRFEKEGV